MSSQSHPELEEHPRRDDLGKLVRTVALAAADERRGRFVDGLDEIARELGLGQDDGKIGSVDVMKALEWSEPPVAQGRALLARLLLRGVALEPPSDAAAAQQIATGLCWLAAHTYLDALTMLERELDGDVADRLMAALAAMVRDVDQRGSPAGRGEALAAAAALAAGGGATARRLVGELVRSVQDPMLRRVFEERAGEPDRAAPPYEAVVGEVVSAPLGVVGLVLWSATGLILVQWAWRLFATALLRCRRPAELRVAVDGVTLSYQLTVLGRRVRERETHIPKDNLARAMREVRYPQLALYAGLLALALGTYLGASYVSDGALVGSPSLIALGAAMFGVGVAVDLVFSSLLPTRRGRHRLIIVPKKGRTLALRLADERDARRALEVLAGLQAPGSRLQAPSIEETAGAPSEEPRKELARSPGIR